MIKFILFLTISLTLCSCLDIETRPEIRTLRRLIKKSDCTLCKKGFQRLSYGGKLNPSIQIISMGYITTQYRFKSIDEARFFFVPLFKEYIKPFNEEKSLRPFLSNYPLDATNLELSIAFVDDKGESLQIPWICQVFTKHGKIIYLIDKPDSTYSVTQFSETFEEAEKKLAAQQLTH